MLSHTLPKEREYGDQEKTLDELLKDKDPKTMFSADGLLGELKKALAERVLNAEMDHHLADSTQDEVSEGEKASTGNHRNGYSKKTVLTENEALELSIPRDRRGTFEPQLIANTNVDSRDSTTRSSRCTREA